MNSDKANKEIKENEEKKCTKELEGEPRVRRAIESWKGNNELQREPRDKRQMKKSSFEGWGGGE